MKTLWWISFIFGMIVDIGLKFLSAPSSPQGWLWGQGHGLRIFVKKSQGQSFCIKVYKTSYFKDPLMDFVHIWHDGRYRSKVFNSTIPTWGWPWSQGHGLRIFIKKVKVFWVQVYIAISSRPLRKIIYIWHVGRYRPSVLLGMISTLDVTEVKVTNLEFSYKSKKIYVKSLYSHIIKTFYYAPNFKEVGGAYCFWVVRPSVRPSVRHAFWCIA